MGIHNASRALHQSSFFFLLLVRETAHLPFAMKLQLLCPFVVALGLASATDDCCHHSGVKCYGTECTAPTPEDEGNDCPNPCPLKKCDIGTLIKCGMKLAQCAGVCIHNIFDPGCVSCLGGMWEECHHCIEP